MPAWDARYTPDDPDLRSEADKEYLALQVAHQKPQAWYNGEIPDVLAIKRNPKTGLAVDNNIKLNLFAKRLDRRRDYLFKIFPDLDSADKEWLAAAWAYNKAPTLWGLALLNGGFVGQVYMQCMEPRPGRDPYPRCILLSNVTTVWQADDVETHLWYEKHYRVGKNDFRQDIVDLAILGLGSGWRIYQYVKPITAGTWDPVGAPVDWPYDLGPIVTWQHWPRAASCYGAGEFGDIHLNTAVNRMMSLGNAIFRNHAFPKTITDSPASALVAANDVDSLWHVPAGSNVWNLEMQSDQGALLTFVEKLTNHYNAQGRTVDIEGGPADFTNITNLAIKVSFMPQDDANEILKRQYGYGIVETSKRLQMLGGQDYASDPLITWKTALPESKLEIAQVATTEDTLGLASRETLATQLGLNWAQEQERLRSEQATMPPPPPPPAIPGAPRMNAPAIRGARLPATQALAVNPITPEELANVAAMHRRMVSSNGR